MPRYADEFARTVVDVGDQIASIDLKFSVAAVGIVQRRLVAHALGGLVRCGNPQ